jgi:dipeptidyl-peptidase-4
MRTARVRRVVAQPPMFIEAIIRLLRWCALTVTVGAKNSRRKVNPSDQRSAANSSPLHLRMVLAYLAALLLICTLSAVGQTDPFDGPQEKKAETKAKDLTLEDLFPKKSHFGKTARGMAWSFDDRYLAYLWNAYDDKGYDLWLYDTKEGKAKRLTSPDLFTAYDRDLPAILERYKKDKEEEERRKKLSDEERKKLEEEDEKKERERKEPLKEYAGVGEFKWANKSNELLFTYKGNLFRLVIGQETPTRLTKTQEAEFGVKYTKDDKGFYFRRDSNLFRMRFDGPFVEQLNPELPKGMTMGDYRLSPDETKLLIYASRSTGPERSVSYITYRERFAEAKTTPRAVADDPFKSEQHLYVYDLNDDPKANPKNDGKPWEIWQWPEGEEMGQAVLAEEPWSPDSKKVVFATWKRDKRELEVLTADLESRKVASVYKDIHEGEHTTPGMTDPFFTPDGQKIVLMLEKSGYRHVWMIDPLSGGATQITRGDFEVYPLKMASDGKSFFAASSKEHPARMDLYRVELPDGTLRRLTDKEGRYGGPVLSHNFEKMAATFGSWKSQTELYIMSAKDRGKETALTASHPGTLQKVFRIWPELFDYKNRSGQTIYGFMFRPPGFKKGDKRPLLIYVYGGPLGTGKTVVDGAFGPDAFMFPMYAAWKLGYLCVAIDPRGASGYSAAFGGANWQEPGKPQVEDLTDGVKWLVANYGIDPKKVGVHGWSFGGFQTQMCLYTAPDVFTLGIAGAGPTEWQNYNNWYSGGVIGKARPGKPEDLDKYSLTHLAKNLKSPLLLLHGVEDTNVLFQDTIKVYRELLQAGKGPLVELVIDPTGGHGLGGDIKTKDRFAIYEAFLMKHWGAYKP